MITSRQRMENLTNATALQATNTEAIPSSSVARSWSWHSNKVHEAQSTPVWHLAECAGGCYLLPVSLATLQGVMFSSCSAASCLGVFRLCRCKGLLLQCMFREDEFFLKQVSEVQTTELTLSQSSSKCCIRLP